MGKHMNGKQIPFLNSFDTGTTWMERNSKKVFSGTKFRSHWDADETYMIINMYEGMKNNIITVKEVERDVERKSCLRIKPIFLHTT